MPNIAGNPVPIPAGVDVNIGGRVVTIKGGKGKQSHTVHPLVSVVREDKVLKLAAVSASKASKALAGTTRALLQNMIIGVSRGFERSLEIAGVGYRAQVQGTVLNLTLGFSHPVNFEIPEGIIVEMPSQTEIVIKGYDKQKVGQVAANIRAYRPPEPYKGKGIKYTDEKIIRKEAKKVDHYMNKKQQRLRRARKTRGRIKRLGIDRLSVHKTPRHFYTQVISASEGKVLLSASTIDKEIKSQIKYGGNVEAAAIVGKFFAERAKKASISKVAFDRSGFKFHGRIKAFADAAREQGILF